LEAEEDYIDEAVQAIQVANEPDPTKNTLV
jgi:hypothetical protein